MATKEKKKESKSEKTRAHIIDTALRLFSEYSFEKTTMRAIASEAGLSLGASYYHFKSKDELVLAYYQITAEEAERENLNLISGTKDFKKRFKAILEFKFSQLSKQRSLIKILARSGVDFSHPLSPFSNDSKDIKTSAISLIGQAIEGSNLASHKILRPQLANLFWLYQMGLILYWANDRSKGQKKTRELMDLSLGMILKLSKLTSLKIFTGINSSILKIINVTLSGLSYKDNPNKVS